MRTANLDAFLGRMERRLQRAKRKAQLAKQRSDIDAFTKISRALGQKRPYIDMDGRERLIGWNERKKDRPRCGARTRAGGPCKAPALPEKERCRCTAA